MSREESNLYLVTGNDEALVSAEALRLWRAFAGETPDEFTSELLQEGDEGPSPDLVYSVIRSLKSPPFMGGRKTVWLKHFTAFDAEGDKKSTAPMAIALRELAEFLKDGLPDDMLLILDGTGIDKRRALFKACAAHGTVTVIDKPDLKSRTWRSDMAAVVARAARAKGVTLASDASDFLIDALGTDTSRIDTELEKVICFRGSAEGTVTLSELEQVCCGKGEEMSWALGDILGKRDIKEALRVVDVLISQNKNDDNYAHAMLLSAAGFFRNAIRIHVFLAENRLKSAVALKNAIQGLSAEQKDAALRRGLEFVNFHPYRAQMLAEQALRYTPAEIIDAIATLRDALWQSMSSSTSVRMALESALMKIIGVVPNRRGMQR